MKRLFFAVMLALAFATANSQTPTYTVPQSSQGTIFNAVSTSQNSGCLSNQGENIWFSTYLIAGGSAGIVHYRLEYSYSSNATCTTGTWFPMSDDSTELTQGEVIGIGSYPFVRANLVAYSAAGGITLSSFYSTTSSSPGSLYGFYNPGQQIRKVVFSNADSSQNNLFASPISTPYGSAAGMLIVVPNATFSGAASISFNGVYGGGGSLALSQTENLSGGSIQTFLMPATPVTSLAPTYLHGTTGAGTFFAFYIFTPPGAALPPAGQPATASNSESTSAANAAISVTFSPARTQAAYVFSISARCSAGTAQLSITDQSASNTQMWSSAATEVGTNTLKFQWNPGFNASLANGDVVIVKLSTCGVANTGTLDVQGSVF